MSPLPTLALLLFLSPSASPQAAKPCEELKAEIAKKIAGNSVKAYSLEIVAKDKDVEGAVVGFCDGGRKKIVYQRNSTPPQPPATGTSRP